MSNDNLLQHLTEQSGNENSTIRKDISSIILKNKSGLRSTSLIINYLKDIALKFDATESFEKLSQPSSLMECLISNTIFYNTVNGKVAPNVEPHGGKSPKYIADKVLLGVAKQLQEEINCAETEEQ